MHTLPPPCNTVETVELQLSGTIGNPYDIRFSRVNAPVNKATSSDVLGDINLGTTTCPVNIIFEIPSGLNLQFDTADADPTTSDGDPLEVGGINTNSDLVPASQVTVSKIKNLKESSNKISFSYVYARGSYTVYKITLLYPGQAPFTVDPKIIDPGTGPGCCE